MMVNIPRDVAVRSWNFGWRLLVNQMTAVTGIDVRSTFSPPLLTPGAAAGRGNHLDNQILVCYSILLGSERSNKVSSGCRVHVTAEMASTA